MTEIFSLRSEGSLVKGQKPKFEYLKILDRNFLGPGCEPKPKPKTKINSELILYNFGIEIDRRLKFKTRS